MGDSLFTDLSEFREGLVVQLDSFASCQATKPASPSDPAYFAKAILAADDIVSVIDSAPRNKFIVFPNHFLPPHLLLRVSEA